MTVDQNDEQLAGLAQQGDREAFFTLYNRYLNKVYNRVRSKVPPEEVDDVVQDIFIAVMRSLEHFEQRSRFNTWLYTIVNRQIADFYRRRYREKSDDGKGDVSLDDVERTLTTSMYEDDTIDEQALVQQALRKLPEHYQDIIYLRFIDKVPFADIATQRGQSVEAVKSLFRRAVQALRDEVGEI
jgi:RNA polymerase sigma-70 factor, ECF subfamily